MKFVICAALIVVAVIVVGQKGLKLGSPSAAKLQVDSPLIGRWDQIGRDGCYIRFTDYGWFRGVINGKRLEGQFQLCQGSAIEFAVTYDVEHRITKKKWTEKEIWESKYALVDNVLKLYVHNLWIEFVKATDSPQKAEDDASNAEAPLTEEQAEELREATRGIIERARQQQ
jgi:hypothetical protein